MDEHTKIGSIASAEVPMSNYLSTYSTRRQKVPPIPASSYSSWEIPGDPGSALVIIPLPAHAQTFLLDPGGARSVLATPVHAQWILATPGHFYPILARGFMVIWPVPAPFAWFLHLPCCSQHPAGSCHPGQSCQTVPSLSDP